MKRCSGWLAYRTAMEQLFDYITKKNGIPIASLTFEMLDAEAVSSFLDWLTAEKKCCANTRNHRLACIRAFFAYASACAPENVTYSAALTKIPIQKQDKYAGVDYMDEVAVEALLKQLDTQTRKGLRDQFFMILMYDTAARIQEMLDLRICDIRPGATPTATLLGKGSKVRTVPLMPETMQHFNNYICISPGRKYLFSRNAFLCGAQRAKAADVRRYGQVLSQAICCRSKKRLSIHTG
ncbi:Tyrosine recombinase XerC [Caprobacter fermentans]|uniref:Tyrosine recombinase XerC n=1 Tax=Caproicibacter fermentans TaxID=2576756 RepID=A0A6N8HWS9_9FIRM|nr:tyrosine-type recombinase/integrase [Caproicibacter fermentans]MVB10291.1 Tyrosine recombinase XerC [Caproicibacter fermentans]